MFTGNVTTFSESQEQYFCLPSSGAHALRKGEEH
jgi:hypothetical protein